MYVARKIRDTIMLTGIEYFARDSAGRMEIARERGGHSIPVI